MEADTDTLPSNYRWGIFCRNSYGRNLSSHGFSTIPWPKRGLIITIWWTGDQIDRRIKYKEWPRGEVGCFYEKLRLPRFLPPVGGAKLLEERDRQSERLLLCLHWQTHWHSGEPSSELVVSFPRQLFFTMLASSGSKKWFPCTVLFTSCSFLWSAQPLITGWPAPLWSATVLGKWKVHYSGY